MTEAAESTLYEVLGGAAGVRALVDRFYDAMDTMPSVAVIRAMHPADLGESRQKLFEFLSGWLGGPSLYIERRGHPRLRARHLPFAIDTRAAQDWLVCMDVALDADSIEPELKLRLMESLTRVAAHMRNTADP